MFETVVVYLFGDSVVGVIHVVDVAGSLPVDLMNGPYGFGVAFVYVGFFHFVP